MSTPHEAVGTYCCPICGYDKPHGHDDKQVAAWRDDELRRDGWTSLAHKPPERHGFYLCRGHVIVPPKDREDSRYYEINGILWQRRTGHLMPAEVLQWDPSAYSFFLAQWTGPGTYSGADIRRPVYVKPTHWRPLPPFGAETLRPAQCNQQEKP